MHISSGLGHLAQPCTLTYLSRCAVLPTMKWGEKASNEGVSVGPRAHSTPLEPTYTQVNCWLNAAAISVDGKCLGLGQQ